MASKMNSTPETASVNADVTRVNAPQSTPPVNPKVGRDARPIRPSRLSSTLALAMWKDVTVASVAGDMPDLSARQTAVLMCVYLEEGPHTVRSLAARLKVTKAVISRAIDRLKSYNYILRADDPRDGRSIVLRRTPDGINYLRDFASLMQREMPDALMPGKPSRR